MREKFCLLECVALSPQNHQGSVSTGVIFLFLSSRVSCIALKTPNSAWYAVYVISLGQSGFFPFFASGGEEERFQLRPLP